MIDQAERADEVVVAVYDGVALQVLLGRNTREHTGSIDIADRE